MDLTMPPRGRDHRRDHRSCDQLPDRPGRSTVRTAAVVFAATLGLAGCADGQDQTGDNHGAGAASSAPSAETVTVTATAEPSAASPVESSAEPTTEPETTPTECSPSTVPVATDAANIAPPFPGTSWSVWQTGNLCAPLGYAELATAGGTGSSPTQLLLYNEGEFLGTGIRCNALGQVTGSTADSVTVQYRWPVGNDSNANMSGRADVTFQWNGSSVDMIGNLPQDATGTAC